MSTEQIEAERTAIAIANSQAVFDWVCNLISDDELEQITSELNIRRNACGLRSKLSGIVGEVMK